MTWTIRRQAVAFGLALFLLATLIRASWVAAAPARMVTAEIQAVGEHLKGLVIVIDPGHGGGDPGAVVRPTREKDLVLAISLQLRDILERQGATVVMTRTEDKDLGGTLREELGRRVALVTEHKAQLFVSVHANRDSCNCWGAQSFYQKGGTAEGRALATAIQAQLRRLTPTTRQALAGDYFVLRTTPVPAAIVEVGFLSNAKEHTRLLEPAYQRTLAGAIALGIADYRAMEARGAIPPNPPAGR